jgi:hypothetical protein
MLPLLRHPLNLVVIAPGVTTVGTAAVQPISATLNGALGSMGSVSSASVYFEYGTTTAYGSITGSQVLLAPGSFSASATDLTAATIYHFRAKVDGGVSGIASGADMTFTTASAVTAGGIGSTGGGVSGITSLINSMTQDGKLVDDLSCKGSSDNVALLIRKGTVAMNSVGLILTTVQIQEMINRPVAPVGAPWCLGYSAGRRTFNHRSSRW